MPKSLRCKIKKLCYNGALTERERDRILKALDQENVVQSTDAVRLISLDDIMAHFPKANFNGDPIENKKAYPYWKTDITGLIDILKSIPMVNPDGTPIIYEESEDKNTSKVKEVALSGLEKGQKFYFKNFQEKRDECEVCHKIVNCLGIEVYYRYVDMPNKTYSRYGDDTIVIVKEE